MDRRFTKISLIFFFLSSLALAAPFRTTYQAKIIKPDGQPLQSSSVNFRFTILDPSASCALYVEDYTAVNMNDTAGLVAFSLGAGVRSFPSSGTASTFSAIFDNSITSFACQAPGVYLPISTDNRKIVMQFNDGTGWQTLPAMTINAVPYSMYAGKSENSIQLNGKADTAFVEYSTLVALNCQANEAIKFNGVSFSCITAGGGPVTSGSVISALGYTPADGASMTALSSSLSSTNSNVSAVSSTVFSVSSTVSSLAGSVSSLQSSVAASFAAITSSQWSNVASGISYLSGNVGIGTTTPVTKLDVSGGVRISMESVTCSASYAGTLRYNASNVEYCNGTSWQAFGVSGAGINNFNGSTSGTQSFATGTGGTAPNFNTSNGVHTLNIPNASTGSVTAGLISNADYTTFTNKITSSAASIAQVLGYIPANDAASGTYAQKANNLSDLTNIITARTNLGLGTFATASSIDLGSASATGTLAIARLPSFTGDATIAAASNTIILSNSGVTAGTYTKVAVDSKGRVTSGAQITSSDVTTALGYTPANSATIVSSQWTTSGTTINYMNGNVGIGTTSPESVLHILSASTISTIGKIENTAAATQSSSYLVLKSNSGSGGNIYRSLVGQDASGNNQYAVGNFGGSEGVITFNNGTSLTERMRIDTSGNVGIGTSSPAAVLDVQAANGSLQVKSTSGNNNAYAAINAAGNGTPYISFQKASTEDWEIGPNTGGVGANHTFNFWDTANSVARISITTGGNVGIGTTTPTATLHLKAGTTTNAPFKFTSGTLLTSPQSGTMEYDGANFYLTDGTNTRRTIATGSSQGTIDNISNINSSSNITMTPNGSVIVSATTASTNTSTGALVVKGGAGIAGDLNVGGSASIANSLTVSGNINGAGNISTGANNRGFWLDTAGSFNYGIWRDSTDNVHIRSGGTTERITIASATGNVGIGTASPAADLSVLDKGGANERALGIDGAAGTNRELAFMTNGTSRWIMGEDNLSESGSNAGSNFYLNAYSDAGAYLNTNFFINRASGNVGIGTITPSAKLSISNGGAETIEFYPANGSGIDAIQFYNRSTSTYDAARLIASDYRFETTGGNEKMRITTGGNVGIGTTDPTLGISFSPSNRLLAVEASGVSGSTLSGGLILANGGTLADTYELGHINFVGRQNGVNLDNVMARITSRANGSGGADGFGATLQFFTKPDNVDGGALERMRIDAAGNIGVATTSPLSMVPGWTPNSNQKLLSITGNASASTNANGLLVLANNRATPTGGDQLGAVVFASTNNNGHIPAYVDGLLAGSGGANGFGGALRFHTKPDNASATVERVRINSDGNVGIGTGSPIGKLHLVDESNVSPRNLIIDNFTVTGGNASQIWGRTARGTAQSPTATQAGDPLLNLIGASYDGSSFNEVGHVRVLAESNQSTSAHDSFIEFTTTTGTSLAERMRITSTGNVGIGTTSPSVLLDLQTGSSNENFRSKRFVGSNTWSNIFRLYQARGTQAAPTASVNGDSLVTFSMGGYDGSGWVDSAGITAYSNGTISAGSIPTDLAFTTGSSGGGSERMRILSNGNVGIGTTSPTEKLHVTGNSKVGDTASTGTVYMQLLGIHDTAGGSGFRLQFDRTNDIFGIAREWSGFQSPSFVIKRSDGNVGIGTTNPSYKLDVSGTIRGFGITDSSDIRLKKDIAPLEFSLEKLLQIKGVSYHWKDKAMPKKQIGFIAQDLEKIYPELVETDQNGMKSVNYSHLVAPLVESFKSLYEKVMVLFDRNEQLTREVAAVKAENAEKTKQLNDIRAYLCSKDPNAPMCK